MSLYKISLKEYKLKFTGDGEDITKLNVSTNIRTNSNPSNKMWSFDMDKEYKSPPDFTHTLQRDYLWTPKAIQRLNEYIHNDYEWCGEILINCKTGEIHKC